MRNLTKMTLPHVEKMSDSEMKQIVGGNSMMARDAGDTCYAAYADPNSSEFTCSGICVAYTHYDSKTQKLTMIPRKCNKMLDFCACEKTGV